MSSPFIYIVNILNQFLKYLKIISHMYFFPLIGTIVPLHCTKYLYKLFSNIIKLKVLNHFYVHLLNVQI